MSSHSNLDSSSDVLVSRFYADEVTGVILPVRQFLAVVCGIGAA